MCDITIYQGFEYRTYIRDDFYKVKDDKAELAITDDFYYTQYKQAALCIDEITTRMEEYRDSNNKEDVVDARFDNDSSLMGYPNNIIAFCSRRGQGKTSAMLTIMRALKEKDERANQEGAELFWNEAYRLNSYAHGDGKSPVLGNRFYVLATIDPTTMEAHDTVLNVILARMMVKTRSVHQSRQKEGRGEKDLPNYRDVMKKIHETVRRIDSVKQKKALGDISELERINETDDNRSPKFAFLELVQGFLEYIDYDFLVISVDDADMAPDRCYEITEDLRKYCVVPQVLIMMAVHLATLKNCVEQHFVDTYTSLLDTKYATDHMPKYACRNIAQRYVDKLLPDLHQIHLHYMEEKIEDGKKVALFYRNYHSPKNLLPYIDENDYVGVLARLVYDKTGVILLDTKSWLHNFMPKRMRELTHMLSYFTRMDDIDDSDGNYDLVNLMIYKFWGEDPGELYEKVSFDSKEADNYIRIRKENLDMLEDYFFEHWCTVNLSKRLCNDMVQLRIAPLESKNRRALEIMRSYEKDGDEVTNNEKASGSFRLEPGVYTYADVLNESKRFRDSVKSPFKYDLRYAIVMYYTICMNKIVCKSLFYGDCGILNELEALTRGPMTCDIGYGFYLNLSDISSWSVDNDDLSNFSLRLVDDAGQQMSSMRRMKDLLYPCTFEKTEENDIIVRHLLSKNNLHKWRTDNSGLTSQGVQYARFDYSCVIYDIIKDCLAGIREYIEKKGVTTESKKAFFDDLGEYKRVEAIVLCLRYLCNNDVQYTLRKRYLEVRDTSPITAAGLLLELFSPMDENIKTCCLADILTGSEKYIKHHLDVYKNDIEPRIMDAAEFVATYVSRNTFLLDITLFPLKDCAAKYQEGFASEADQSKDDALTKRKRKKSKKSKT